DRDVDEAGGRQASPVLGEGQCAGDTAAVGAALGALGGREVVVRDDVADANAAAGPKDAGDLVEDRGLVGRQVDHAVADHDVDGGSREGDRLDRPADELDVVDAGLGGVTHGQVEHLVGHVEPDGA